MLSVRALSTAFRVSSGIARTIRFSSSTTSSAAPNVLSEKKDGNVLLLRLNRPKALNALCDALMLELNDALATAEKDTSVGAIVITGSEKAFAAGADIKEMEKRGFAECLKNDMLGFWSNVSRLRKPVIAAVNGYALGGGCELAMMCDIIVAGEGARFGQPEVKIGTIPGGGATQRLTRAMGKSRAMEIILTGEPFSAQEAERAGIGYCGVEFSVFCVGLISHVVPDANVVDKALEIARNIARHSQPVIALAKEAVQQSFETPLTSGLLFEKRVFHSTFALKDQKEGMGAFRERRAPVWTQE